MNPKAPTLKAQIKLHNIAMTMRPVTNYIETPTYKLAEIKREYVQNYIHLKGEHDAEIR
jgi:hypothetical protein